MPVTVARTTRITKWIWGDQMKIYDLIYAGEHREKVKADMKKLFPDAKLEDDNECDYLHEGRFSIEIEDYKGELVDYMMAIIEAGLFNLSLMYGVKSRTDKELFEELLKRLKAKGLIKE